uniref:Putative phosphatidylglycerophosphatase and protein-tyrosine phosphatase 1 n=1 Tax=Helianthus annuus TaxID=4232 RepID=A0A251UHL8_HELAN
MHIEDLKKGVGESSGESGGLSDSKRVLVGAGARALFYPTLLYNVVRNRFEPDFRWWDQIQEFLLLGAVPFPSDVKRLKDLGVHGVITLNEPYETLVPTSLYKAHGIDHLVLPTRDYLFAPSLDDIFKAVNFIHGKTLLKQATYVHCKAGRGRSTTIVICYLAYGPGCCLCIREVNPAEGSIGIRSASGSGGILPSDSEEDAISKQYLVWQQQPKL